MKFTLSSSGRSHRSVVALMAGVLLGATSGDLAAQIYHSGPRNIAIPADFDGVYLDLDTGTSSTTEFSGWDINPFFGGYAIANSAGFQPVRLTTANDSLVVNLAYGTIIGSGSTYASTEAGSEGHLGTNPGQFVASTDGYLGFRFTPSGGGGPYYGWMRLSLTVNTSGALIRDWGYDTTGAPIAAGATPVPEPATYACATVMALAGFAGIRRWRRGVAGVGRAG